MGICAFCCCSTILVALVCALGITGFVSWIIVGVTRLAHLKPVNYQVSGASLTQFNLTTNDNTLDYNLALNITLENPNKKIGVHYDPIEATASFKNHTLNNVTFNSFYLGHKKAVVFAASFKGHRSVALGTDEVAKFKNAAGFDIVLNLDTNVWIKVIAISKANFKSRVACYLKVPLNSNGNSAQSFKITQCKAQSSDK